MPVKDGQCSGHVNVRGRFAFASCSLVSSEPPLETLDAQDSRTGPGREDGIHTGQTVQRFDQCSVHASRARCFASGLRSHSRFSSAWRAISCSVTLSQ